MKPLPMSDHARGEDDPRRLTLRARLGMMMLGARSLVVHALVFGASILLARVLDPADFGVFAIVQFALLLSQLFGDAGLGGALVQQKTPPTQRELSSVFWVHCALCAFAVTLVWIGAPYAMRLWPTLPPQAPWLLRALSISLFFGFTRSIPTILMERDLQYGRLSLLEVLQSIAFYLCVVPLAFSRFGVWSLVAGVVFQSFVSFVATFACRPWRPSLVFDRAVLAPMIRFGLPFQLKGVISFVNDAVTPLYAGNVLGDARLGFFNFGKTTAYFPLHLVGVVGRVSFPLYSRLRDDPKRLAAEIEKNVKVCLWGTLFFVGLVLGLGSNLVSVVYGDKWLPAIPALYVMSLAISIGFLSPIVGAAFDAIGEPRVFVRLSIVWTVVNWLSVLTLTPLFPAAWKVAGFAVAYAVHVVFGNLAVIWVMQRKLPNTRIFPHVVSATIAAATVAAFGRCVLHPRANGVTTFTLAVVACAIVFVAVVVAIDADARTHLRALLRGHRSPSSHEVDPLAPAQT